MMDKSSQELYDTIINSRKNKPVMDNNICIEVQRFAVAMQEKLWKNRRKGGWRASRKTSGCSPKYIQKRLHEEIDELFNCSNAELLGEAADVANFLMMMCDNRGLLEED